MASRIAQQLCLEELRYSQVWEDHLLLEAGLDVGPEDDVLCIGSAGCNVLALLLKEPRSITAIDMSPAQSALVSLKLAGIRHLSHEDFVRLLGVRPGADRLGLYERLRPLLSDPARVYFDARAHLIEAGLLNAGRLDAYFQGFREEHLAHVWPADLAERLLEAPDLEAQRRLFQEADTEAFRARFLAYFCRERMARRGRDPAQFEHVTVDDLGAHFLRRFTWACTALPIAGNFYLEAFLTGRFRDLRRAPVYLRPDSFPRLRQLVGRVEVVTADLEEHFKDRPVGTYSKAGLSDVFEYMSADEAALTMECLALRLRPGGRVCYWNLLVPRGPAPGGGLRPLEELARELTAHDRAWFYESFHVDEVVR